MSNMYDILGKLKNLLPGQEPVETAKEPVYESVESRGDIMEAVKSLEEKYMGFKKTVAAIEKGGSAEDPEAVAAAIGRKKYGKAKFQKAAAAGKKLGEAAKPDFLDLDDDGDTEEPMKSAAKSAKEHEPAKVDKSAVEKRKRLQALKDKQEDERAERGDDHKSHVRKVKGKAYGGAAQKDDEEKDLDESGLQAYLGKKKYGEEGMKALQKAGREGASKEKMALLRAKHDKMDEVAPPGAKAERMVKHIKKGYSKDGKLTPKEKGIAYATAWKAHNKGQVEEGVKFSDTIKNSKAELKKAKPAMVKESRVMEETDYFYEKVGKALAEKDPTLDTASPDFVVAVRKEMVAQGIDINRARNIITTDEDFINDVATSYGHNVREIEECGYPINSHLGGAMEELDEIARLAGIQREGNAFTGKLAATPKGGEFELGGKTYQDNSDLGEAAFEEQEMDEGNEFTKARLDAIKAGKDTFTVGGKVHKVSGDTSQERVQVEEGEQVNEDLNINISANGEQDVLNIVRKLAGMAEVEAPVQNVQADDEGSEVEVAEERDIEWDNTPDEITAPISAATPNGTDLHRSKKQDPHTANKAANPLKEKELEESLWKKYEDMINDIKA